MFGNEKLPKIQSLLPDTPPPTPEIKGRADTLAEGPKHSQPLNPPLMLGYCMI